MRKLSSRIFRLFAPLLFPYRELVFLRRYLIRGEIPAIPVISVGNIAFGGTGKTPVTIFLSQHYSKKDFSVGVGIRGYRGKIKGERAYSPGEEINPFEAGDEAAVLREALPNAWIFVGKRREVLAEMAKSRGINLLILDDAFQYLKLKKIEVVLHSLEVPDFYLRESKRALRRAHLILQPLKEASNTPYTYFLYPEGVPEERVFAFCGIARPEKFLSLFPKLENSLIFPDHHRYTPQDLDEVYHRSRGLPVYTTEKDFVKIKRLENFRGGIFVINWRAKVSQEALLRLDELLKSWPLVLK